LLLLPTNINIFSNENIYILNDLAINFLKKFAIKNYIFPYENDYPNLISGKDRHGIIPIYFKPELFYSRVPIKAKDVITDENKNEYNILKINGFTIITDIKSVSLTHFIDRLEAKGFSKFLIDFSYEDDMDFLKIVLDYVKKSEKMPNTKDFNMKKGLK
jgi:putative protease